MVGFVLGKAISQLDSDQPTIDRGRGPLIVDERFSSASDWFEGEDDKASARLVDGTYRVEIKRSSLLFVTTSGLRGDLDGVSVGVDASPEDGSRELLLGVGCEAERGRGYHFLVDPWNSRFLILESRTDGSFAEVGGGTDLVGTILPPGESNRLRAECVHRRPDVTALRFYVNDRPIFAHDVRTGWTAFRGTSVAAASVGAPNVAAVFDNAFMSELTQPSDPRILRAEKLVPEPDPSIVSVELRHGFGDPRSAPFGIERASDHSFEYESGEYAIRVGVEETWWRWSRWYESSFRSVTVATVVRKASLETGRGRFGVYCVAASDPNDIYGFLVDPDEGWYQIWKLEDDRFEPILAEGDSSVIGFGSDPSYIRGECSSRAGSTDLWMYVNGHFVTSVHDPDGFGKFDGVGLLARAIDGSTDARFDNVFYAGIRP